MLLSWSSDPLPPNVKHTFEILYLKNKQTNIKKNSNNGINGILQLQIQAPKQKVSEEQSP